MHFELSYGSAIINRLSVDLKSEFPNMGFSPRNLWNMKQFYDTFSIADQKLQQLVAVLPWGHNVLLMNRLSSKEEFALQTANAPIGVAKFQLDFPEQQIKELIRNEIINK